MVNPRDTAGEEEEEEVHSIAAPQSNPPINRTQNPPNLLHLYFSTQWNQTRPELDVCILGSQGWRVV